MTAHVTFTAPLVGAHYRPPAKALLQVLPAGCELVLTPEPDNPFDSNAVMVSVATAHVPAGQHDTLRTLAAGYGFELDEVLQRPEWHLGYVARQQAAELQGGSGALSGPTPGRLAFDASGKPQIVLARGGGK